MARADRPADGGLVGRQGVGVKEEQRPHVRALQGVQQGLGPVPLTLEGQGRGEPAAARLRRLGAVRPALGGRGPGGGGGGAELLHIVVVAHAHGVGGRVHKAGGAHDLLAVGDADEGAVIGGGIAVLQAEVAAHPRQGHEHPAAPHHRPHVHVGPAGRLRAGAGVDVEDQGPAETVKRKDIAGAALLLPVGHPQVHPGVAPVEHVVGDVEGPVDPGGHGLQREIHELVVLRHDIDLHAAGGAPAHGQGPHRQHRRQQAGQDPLFPAHISPPLQPQNLHGRFCHYNTPCPGGKAASCAAIAATV